MNKTSSGQYPTEEHTEIVKGITGQTWWYSTDGRRGFCWSELVAWDYRKASGTSSVATLYAYLHSGIYHLEGAEAEFVYQEIIKRRAL